MAARGARSLLLDLRDGGTSWRIWSLLGWSGFARRKRNGVASTTCAASTAGLSWAGQAGLWLRTLPWHRLRAWMPGSTSASRRRPGGLYGETSHTQLARWQLGSVGSLTCARRAERRDACPGCSCRAWVLGSKMESSTLRPTSWTPVRYNGQRQLDG